jgi:hypothetical protein
MDQEPGTDQDPVVPLDPSWDAEIRRRILEIESGQAVLIPLEQARKRIFGDE